MNQISGTEPPNAINAQLVEREQSRPRAADEYWRVPCSSAYTGSTSIKAESGEIVFIFFLHYELGALV